MKKVYLDIVPPLNEFLKEHKKQNGDICTHTSMKGGSYCIPHDKLDDLHLCYHNICANTDVEFPALTEIKKEYSPVVIDIDLKLDKKFNKRLITKKHISQIISLFSDFLNDPNYILMQREKPYLKDDIYKDGIHLVFPDTVLNTHAQLDMREKLMPDLETILSDLPLINKIEDIYDRSVPANNAPWLLYFSTKPGTIPYRLTKSYKSYKDNGYELLDALSLRKHGHDPKKKNKKNNKKNNINKNKKSKKGKLIKYKKSKDSDDDDEYDDDFPSIKNRVIPLDSEEGINICKLIDRVRHNFPQHDLHVTKIKHCGHHIFIGTNDHFCPFIDRNHKRKSASMYLDICEKGICLRCYDSDCQGEMWPSKHIPIPKDSPVYNMFKDNNIIINNYNNDSSDDDFVDFDTDDLQVFDDPEKNNVLLESLIGTHYDIAKLIFLLNKEYYRCKGINSKIWLEFKDHRWQEGIGFINYISDQLTTYYKEVLEYYKKRRNEQEYRKKYKEINDLIKKLKTTNFKNSIITECCGLFYDYDKTFFKRLNNNAHLLGFENGIYDLLKQEFRDGKPSDCLSYTVGYDFPLKKKLKQEIKEVKQFLKQVFPIESVRKYIIKLMASCLNGDNTDELFHIFTGSGANGKSKFIDLNTLALGEYGFRISISLLTQKRASSNSANPELADKMGKRMGIFQEPDKGDEIKVGIMKEFTGGDIISVRQLYGQQFEFKPQFTLFLCCNDLPKIPSNDGGTWRRMRVIEFVSKFVDQPDPEKPYEFPIDRHLKNKINGWAPAYMYILLQYYSLYLDEGLEPPDEVVKFTKMYQEETNILSKFINECIIRTDNNDDNITITEVKNKYEAWHKDNYDSKPLPKKDLSTIMDNLFGYRQFYGPSYGRARTWLKIKFTNSD